jgi:tripartite-type tricarboxylate transporter receptor subunit TctC
MIVANNDVKPRNPAELVALLKANPGRYSYATSGVGTVHHLGFEMLKARTGTFIVHIPYRGAAQIMPDVISGQVPIGVVSAAAGLAQARQAACGDRPHEHRQAARRGERARAGRRAARLQRRAAHHAAGARGHAGAGRGAAERSVRAVLASADLAQAAAQQGAVPSYLNSGGLAADLARESAEWGRIVKQQKVTLE